MAVDVRPPLSKAARSALWYAAERQWRVFPLHSVDASGCSCGRPKCDSPGKHPRNDNGCSGATTDPDIIAGWWARWPDANVGIATGRGLVVIDIDPGHDGDGTLVDLKRTLGALPDTVEVITGSGGRHIYLEAPVEVRNSQGNAGGLGAGVDVRGDGGYVVAPPSVHRSGRSYAWEASSRPEAVDVAPLPDAWLAAMTARPKLRVIPGSKGEPIPEGQRDTTLFKLAASMRANGCGEGAIRAALAEENAARCVPPMEAKDIERIAGSVCRYAPGLSPEFQAKRDEAAARRAPAASSEPAPEPEVFNRGDSVEIAARLLVDLGRDGGHPVVYDRGAFWRYDAGRGVFVEVDRGEVYRAVGAYAGAPRRTEKGVKGLALSDAAIKGAINAAAHLAARPGFFDAAPRGVVFSNGFVCVRGGDVVVEAHDPGHRATHALAVAHAPYDAEGDACAMWLQMLREIFRRQIVDEVTGTVTGLDGDDTEDCIRLLQEFAGAALMGMATSYAVCLVLHGPGNDGKSRILNVIRALFPPTAVCSIAPQDWGRGFLLAGLAGKRLNVVNELPERDMMESARFKAVVAGDSLTAERKNQDPFTLVPECGEIFACNDLPATRDQSRGFWRRFAVLLCNRQFEAHEEVKDIDKVVIGAELGGIASWAVEGAARLQRSSTGYTIPASSQEAKEDWQQDSDQIRQWASACCDKAEKAADESTIAVLYPSYRRWASETGHQPVAQNKLASRLKGLGHEHRTKLARLYRLKLKPAPPIPGHLPRFEDA